MIKDARNRKWMMRFKQYRKGWLWNAHYREAGLGLSSTKLFPSRAQAEADARRHIQGRDPIAEKLEFSK
jgi:hypothetical protein